LIVGDENNPTTWQLPYRDPDRNSKLTDRWGRRQRYTKAGPINCRRVRAALAALRGARGSRIRLSDLDQSARRKLRAAVKACGIETQLELAALEAAEVKATRRGGDSVIDKVKKKVLELASLFSSDVEPDDGADDMPDEPGNADEPQAQTVDLAAKLEEEAKRAATLEAELEKMKQERMAERADRMVESLLSERVIVPAQKDKLKTLLLASMAQTVKLSTDDGKEAEHNLADLIVETLREGGAVSEQWFSQLSVPEEPKAKELAKKAERIAQQVNPKVEQ